MSRVLQAYRFALEPSVVQEAALRSHCGAQRFAFNWGLARVKATLAQRQAEASYGIEGEDLTPSLDWTAYSLRKDWNATKDGVAPWWRENSKEAYSSGLMNLATALKNWIDSTAGRRTGAACRFPRFRGRRSGWSCRFTTGAFGLAERDRRHVRLPRIGLVRTHESTRKLARHVERGTARVRSGTVSLRAGRWFVSFSVEITRTDPAPARPGTPVGVVETSSPSCGATINEPDGNSRQTRTTRAAGTATGRPAPPGTGQRRHGNASAQDTFSHTS